MKPTVTSSRPAPGGLVVVQEFVNTRDVETGEDRLADPPSALEWMVQAGLMRADDQVEDHELAGLRSVRESIRSLLLANTHGDVDSDAVAALNHESRRSRLTVKFLGESQAELASTEPGVPGALAKLFGVMFEAMTDGTWKRLKACLNDECHWAFYDHSKNQSGTWCSMAVCGSRMKARAYRRRQEESR